MQNRSDRSRSDRSFERREQSTNRNEGRTFERRERSTNRSEGRTYERRDTNRDNRRDERRYADTQRYRSDRRDTRYEREQRYRNDSRYRNGSRYHGGSSRHRQPYYAHGRIDRCERWGGGYRVWIGGARYPFYVPLSHWHRDRFRVGLVINLGGYYNPLGYYDYYYNDGYRGLSRADFRGVVETVDYRRDTFVVRNDDTGDYITVVLRDRNEPLPRPGDYVAVRGDWTTRGYFRAYDLDFLDRY